MITETPSFTVSGSCTPIFFLPHPPMDVILITFFLSADNFGTYSISLHSLRGTADNKIKRALLFSKHNGDV